MTEENKYDVSHHSLPPRSIVLKGLTGSGKSSLGYIFSQIIGFGFVDLDHYIEKSEKKNSKYF